ncbi:uncharacterized protein LOC134819524 isoform X2 [Bolinopsis microptera]|uniref:uncharacterized protein LOC134819524 isoform X2 n=1 Tax=Bolinopsis microptera TaxID=2820187 RepID=UPI003079476E
MQISTSESILMVMIFFQMTNSQNLTLPPLSGDTLVAFSEMIPANESVAVGGSIALGMLSSVHLSSAADDMISGFSPVDYVPNFAVGGLQSSPKLGVFSVVDPNGDPVPAGQYGLLLYKGGMVCSPGFSDIAADFICKKMGITVVMGWLDAYKFTLQDELKVTINDINCSDDDCTWSAKGIKCSSNKSVFLNCGEEKGDEKESHDKGYNYKSPNEMGEDENEKTEQDSSCFIHRQAFESGESNTGPAKDANDCKSLCSKMSTCVAFTFVIDYSQCLTYSSVGKVCSSASLNSFEVVSGLMSCFEERNDNNRNDEDGCINFGFHIKGTSPVEVSRSKTISQCIAACKKSNYCASFTFVEEEGRCLKYDEDHLEFEISRKTMKNKVQSALMSCFESEKDGSCLIRGKKYAKGNIDTVSAGTVEQCAGKCKRKTDCEAFTVCTLMKRCWLYDFSAFSVKMEDSRKTRSYISSERLCYFGDDESREKSVEDENIDEDTCMNDSRRIWGGIMKVVSDSSSYYDCKNLCERTKYCEAFSLCKKTHKCVLFKHRFKLRSQSEDPNWCSGILRCYDQQGSNSKEETRRDDVLDDGACQFGLSQGFCKSEKYIIYMEKYCRRTCDKELELSASSEGSEADGCKDSFDGERCNYLKSIGYCKFDSKIATDYCPVTCENCDGSLSSSFRDADNSTIIIDTCIDLYSTAHCISRIEACEDDDDLQLYCRKTCGLCNESDPPEEALEGCSDKIGEATCTRKSGRCNSDFYMERYCRKTCGFCEKESGVSLASSSSSSEPACENQYGSQECEFYAAVNMCEYANIKRTLCRVTCKMCVPELKEDLTCEDDKGEYNCRIWRDLGYCVRDSIRYTHCRKTCAVCGEDNCEDKRLQSGKCEYFKKIGYCESQSKVRNVMCPKTCRNCQGTLSTGVVEPVPVDASCKDRYETATCLSQIGKCDTKKSMKFFCRRTCGFCKDEDPADFEEECDDLIGSSECDRLNSVCATYRPMRMNCRKTCQFCTAKERPQERDGFNKKECTDTDPEFCRGMEKFCRAEGIQRNCPVTCKICASDSDGLKSAVRPQRSSRDSQDPSCRDADKTYCLSMSSYCSSAKVRKSCPKSCNICKINKERQSVSGGVCGDRMGNRRCSRMNTKGHCEKTSKMKIIRARYCRKTCGTCKGQDADSMPGTLCRDEKETSLCLAFESHGDCVSDEVIRNKHCRKSCGTCQDGSPMPDNDENKKKKDHNTSKKDTDTCKDREVVSKDCGEWKSQGYCESRKQVKEILCKKTCGACGDNDEKKVENIDTDEKKGESIDNDEKKEEMIDNDEKKEESIDNDKKKEESIDNDENKEEIIDNDEKKEESIDNDEKKEKSVDNDEKKDNNKSEKDTESCDDKEGADRCGRWKSEGYCETNIELKEIFCKRTCGSCEGLTLNEGEEAKVVPRSQYIHTASSSLNQGDQINCKDRWSDCVTWDRKCDSDGYTDYWCANTCQSCSKQKEEGVGLSGAPTQSCQDTVARAVCAMWRSKGFCGSRTKIRNIFCKKTCGSCESEMNETSSVSEDNDDYDCKNLDDLRCPVQKKYCTTDEVKKLCPKTCGTCGRIPKLVARKAMKNNDCQDADIYRCPFLKAKCAKTDVHTMCPKSCGICGITGLQSVGSGKCGNRVRYDVCAVWKAKGMCDPKNSGYRSNVRGKLCKKTCNSCEDGSLMPDNDEKKDESIDNEEKKDDNKPKKDTEKNSSRTEPDNNKKESDGKGGNNNNNGDTDKCEDLTTYKSRCGIWKSRGFCSRTKIRESFCKNTCGTCKDGSLMPDNDEKKDENIDNEEKKDDNKSKKDTEKSSSRTEPDNNKKESDGKGGNNNNNGDTDKCEDLTTYKSRCGIWKSRGFCSHTKIRETFCKNTCGTCKGQSDGSPMPDKDENKEKKDNNKSKKATETCKDRADVSKECGEWKSQGYCESQKQVKEILCKKTCGACGDNDGKKVENIDTDEKKGESINNDEKKEESIDNDEKNEEMIDNDEKKEERIDNDEKKEESVDNDEKKEESIDNDEKKEESIDNDEKKDDNKSEKDTESCDDKEGADRCGKWKSEGYCETNIELKEIFCKRTCGSCEGVTLNEGEEAKVVPRSQYIRTASSSLNQAPGCKDADTKFCKHVKSECYEKGIQEICPKTCRVCQAKRKDNERKEGRCNDQSVDCAFFSGYFCKKFLEVAKMCPESCGVCDQDNGLDEYSLSSVVGDTSSPLRGLRLHLEVPGVKECLREGVSFVGSPTARYEEVTETSECYTKCATRAGCVAFSLYKDTGSCMLKNAWLNPEPVTNHEAKDVVSASMDCILDAVGKVDKIIYKSQKEKVPSGVSEQPPVPDSFIIQSSIGRSKGCDLSRLPDVLGFYPDKKTNLDVGDSVIMYCKTPPTNPKLVDCSAHDSISFSDYPVCESKDKKFEEDRRRDEVEDVDTWETQSCYNYGGVYPGGTLKVQLRVRTLAMCQRMCENRGGCVAFTIVQRNWMCILRGLEHGELEKTSRLARNGDVVSASMDCIRKSSDYSSK